MEEAKSSTSWHKSRPQKKHRSDIAEVCSPRYLVGKCSNSTFLSSLLAVLPSHRELYKGKKYFVSRCSNALLGYGFPFLSLRYPRWRSEVTGHSAYPFNMYQQLSLPSGGISEKKWSPVLRLDVTGVNRQIHIPNGDCAALGPGIAAAEYHSIYTTGDVQWMLFSGTIWKSGPSLYNFWQIEQIWGFRSFGVSRNIIFFSNPHHRWIVLLYKALFSTVNLFHWGSCFEIISYEKLHMFVKNTYKIKLT